MVTRLSPVSQPTTKRESFRLGQSETRHMRRVEPDSDLINWQHERPSLIVG
jgi:hypothetical protein